ncbi:hypothetical protein [Longispora albida]|uniref:hypothetical protein n=1 Tax=Longispora albida TaxID=203523 RepID=UPI00037EDCA8|nr:hypothetical protein [Longispora albida]
MRAEDVVRSWKDPDNTAADHPAGQISLAVTAIAGWPFSDLMDCTTFPNDEDEIW